MRFKVLGQNGRTLTRSAAILAVGTLTAGCSSSAMRFDDFTDGLFTGSTQNQRQIISKAENQPFPGDTIAAAPVNGVTPQGALAPVEVTGSVQRSALAPAVSAVPAPAPVRSAALAPAPAAATGSGLLPAPSKAAAQPALVAPQPASDPLQKVPATVPGNEVAVLPQTPKLKEPQAASQPTAASAATQAPSGGYTVVAGDTLFGIARKTGASAEAIKKANGLSNGFLRIGQTLTIPGSGSAQVTSAKTDPAPTGAVVAANEPQAEPKVEPAAYTPPVKNQRLVEQVALNPSEAAPDATGIGRMRWPVRGRVISAFGGSGGGKSNDGIDIAVPEGTPVKAAENGVVIYAGDGLKEFGNTVLVRHEDGLVTVYGHAGEIKVARGENVRRGQEIASSGMSGSADTPKLHFEVRKDSAPVDPSQFLE